MKQHNVLEVLKSAGALPKGDGPIVQVLDSIRRWEEQFLQVLRGLNLACSVYGKPLLNGVHSTLTRLNKKKFAIEQIETKYKGSIMLSLSDMRKAFFHIIQPVVHDELFDFALKMAREANLDARAISEEDTLLFFKRIVAKLHGVNLNKEFS